MYWAREAVVSKVQLSLSFPAGGGIDGRDQARSRCATVKTPLLSAVEALMRPFHPVLEDQERSTL